MNRKKRNDINNAIVVKIRKSDHLQHPFSRININLKIFKRVLPIVFRIAILNVFSFLKDTLKKNGMK